MGAVYVSEKVTASSFWGEVKQEMRLKGCNVAIYRLYQSQNSELYSYTSQNRHLLRTPYLT